MAPTQYINATEFMEVLKANGLVIVSAHEFELNLSILRKRYMKRKALALSEIVKAKLLPLRTAKGVNDWILSGKIKAGETYIEASGHKRVMVLTSAIRRLGYED